MTRTVTIPAITIERSPYTTARVYIHHDGVRIIVRGDRRAFIEGPHNPRQYTPTGRKFAADALRAWRKAAA